MLVDELAAVIRIDSVQRERQLLLNGDHGLHNPVAALGPHRLAFHQQVWIFTLSKVWRNTPLAEAPECETRSISR